MSVTHPVTTRDVIADTVTALVDVGGTGTIELQETGNTPVVATLTFSATAFLASSIGVCDADTIADDTNAAGGTIALFQIKSGAGTVIVDGTVGIAASGEDIIMTSLSITATDTVELTSLTYASPV